jgi:tetratricopeptide (TPR) repeat protein
MATRAKASRNTRHESSPRPDVPRGAADPALVSRAAAAAILLVPLVIVAFAPCLANDFVRWDDDRNFLENRSYRGLGWPQIRWAWTTFHLGVYQPLSWMLLEAEYAIWGLNPRGYHATSLALFAAGAVVLHWLVVRLLDRALGGADPGPTRIGAALAVALFVAHPLRAEVVAWASCQPYLPCALFAMLSVLAYLRASREGPPARWGWLAASFALFAAALLSKAVAVSLPAVLLILDVYPLRRLGGGPGRWSSPEARRVWWEKVPYLGLSLVFMGIAVAARQRHHALVMVREWGPSARVAQACYATWFYLIKTAWPADLSAFYPLPRQVDWTDPPFLLRILATLGVTVGSFLLRRRWPGLLAAWLSYLAILAPNLGLLRTGDQVAADRYSFLATMGGVVLLAAVLRRLLRAGPARRPVAVGSIAACLVAILALVFLTRDQCRTWRSSEALWTHALAHGAGRSDVAHYNLGVELDEKGRLEEAAAQYAEALRFAPHHAGARNNLGAILFRQGKIDEAIAHYTEALRIDPAYPDAHNNMGAALFQSGKTDEAIAHYTEALRLVPNHADAHNNLGVALSRRGRIEDAVHHFAEALRIDPDRVDAHKNLGAALLAQGRFDAAAGHLAETVRLDPGDAGTRVRLGMALAARGRIEDALAQYAEALKLSPDNAVAHNNRAMIWAAHPEAKYRDGRRAVESATRACELTGWKDPRALDSLAASYAEAGDFGSAVSWQARAIELADDDGQRADLRSRLKLYQAGHPYREPSGGQ